jgi:hypothetical protein
MAAPKIKVTCVHCDALAARNRELAAAERHVAQAEARATMARVKRDLILAQANKPAASVVVAGNGPEAGVKRPREGEAGTNAAEAAGPISFDLT